MPLTTNFAAWGATMAGAVGFVGLCGAIGRTGILPKRLNRKLMHIGTGPIYALFWPLFPAGSAAARWVCATVPLLAASQFALVGLGVMPDLLHLVPGATRHNRREELLRGPLLYGIVHAALAGVCWRHSPGALLAIGILCGGDGLAEVVGRSAGPSAARLPHNPSKTVAGSLACLLGGAAFALPLLLHFRQLGLLQPAGAAATAASSALLQGWPLLKGVLLCSAVGAAVESLPVEDIDNVTIALAVALTSRLYFGF